MMLKVLRFVRLPMLLILLFALGRLLLGLRGVPYAPRGNAIFSVVILTLVSSLYFGALSRAVGRFRWSGTLMVGLAIGVTAQILVFSLTMISFFAGLSNSYYLNPDAVGVPAGTQLDLRTLLFSRIGGFIANTIMAMIVACLGRLLSGLVPAPEPGVAERVREDLIQE